MIRCGNIVGSCEVGNETPSSVEFVELFDRVSAAPEGLCSNELDARNKHILLSEI